MSVEFSCASVIINLQTWVLLLDYLGIGIPTPPPTPTHGMMEEEGEDEEEEEEAGKDRGGLFSESRCTGDYNSMTASVYDPAIESMYASCMATSTTAAAKLDQSLVQDALDFGSLLSGDETGLTGFSGLHSGQRHPGSKDDTSSVGGMKDKEWRGREGGRGEREGSKGREELDIILESLEEQAPQVPSSDEEGSVWGMEGKPSMSIILNVRSLTVTFNKPEHPLAQGMVTTLVANIETNRGNINLSGSLGQASLVDLTETGAYYRER